MIKQKHINSTVLPHADKIQNLDIQSNERTYLTNVRSLNVWLTFVRGRFIQLYLLFNYYSYLIIYIVDFIFEFWTVIFVYYFSLLFCIVCFVIVFYTIVLHYYFVLFAFLLCIVLLPFCFVLLLLILNWYLAILKYLPDCKSLFIMVTF